MVRLAAALTHAAFDAERRDWLAAISDRLGPDVLLVPDHTRQGVWPPTREAWQRLAGWPGATHGIVLQDDMRPCAGWHALAERAIATAPPGAAVSFFTGRAQAVARARAAGTAWITSPGAVWGGTLALPLPLVRRFLSWAADHAALLAECNVRTDDARYALFLLHSGTPTYCALPSLFQHIGAHTSLIGNSAHASGRVAVEYVDDPGPLDFPAPERAVSVPVGLGTTSRRAWTLLQHLPCTTEDA